jgi:FkbM family methyltransferase
MKVLLSTRQKMVMARFVQQPILQARRLARFGPITEVWRRGIRWSLDLRDGIEFSIWLRGYFEPSTVTTYRRLIQLGATVLDIGANIGAHTLHLAAATGAGGQVIAFEPTDYAFERLAHNVALNPHLEQRIRLEQTMLVDSDEAELPRSVVASWPLVPASQLQPLALGRAHSTSGATAMRLDSSLRSLGVDRVDFVKLDVDGHEIDVLRGAPLLLSRSRPTILFEVAPSQLDGLGRRIEDVLDLLVSFGYRIVTLHKQDVTPDTISRLRRTGASINAVAEPTAGLGQ